VCSISLILNLDVAWLLWIFVHSLSVSNWSNTFGTCLIKHYKYRSWYNIDIWYYCYSVLLCYCVIPFEDLARSNVNLMGDWLLYVSTLYALKYKYRVRHYLDVHLIASYHQCSLLLWSLFGLVKLGIQGLFDRKQKTKFQNS
jgi:hypothetical protein